MDTTFSRYSPGFYYFLVLTLIRPFFSNRRDSFSILARILSFPGSLPDSIFFDTHTDSTLFRYSSGQFFDTRMDSTFSRYSHGFYHIAVLTLIRPFFCNRRDSFSILARILSFPDSLPDSTIFRYSH